MELRQIADALGIETYPEALEQIYHALPAGEPACDLALIHRLETEHGIFREYYAIVRETAVKINEDPVRSTWVRVAAQYAQEGDSEQAYQIPEPTLNGKPENDLLLLYVLLPQIPGSVERYRARGFSEEELADLMEAYVISIRILEGRLGRPAINQAYYNWLLHFTKSLIFKTGGLQFELKSLPALAVWLRSRKTGQLMPLMVEGTFHASGVQRLGSFGYTDETDAFTPVFSEDEENYYGHGVYGNITSTQSRAYSKQEWQCVGRPGDQCLSMHIPRGADITRQTTLAACKNAYKIVKERFPEHSGRLVICKSWLMNPNLKQILGDQSRITQFMECFTKYPNRDPAGSAMFGFVFNGRPENLADLPEDTSLRRKLKALYLNGGCLHSYSGAIYMEE